MSLRILDELPNSQILSWPQWEDYVDFGASNGQPQESTSPHFLRLPREIRDLIYGHFLEAWRPPPPSPPFAGPRIYALSDDGDSPDGPLKKDIAFPTSLAQTNIYALLHTNRLIRSEILQLADKRNQNVRSLNAEMDLMVSGHVVYPLWTRLPMLASPKVDLNVTVTCRVYSPESFGGAPGGSPGSIVARLFQLLAFFLRAGPAFTLVGKPSPDTLTPTVNMLTVRMHNYDIYTPRMFPDAVLQVVRACKAFTRMFADRKRIRCIRVAVDDPEHLVRGLEREEWTYHLTDDLEQLRDSRERNSSAPVSSLSISNLRVSSVGARFNVAKHGTTEPTQ